MLERDNHRPRSVVRDGPRRRSGRGDRDGNQLMIVEGAWRACPPIIARRRQQSAVAVGDAETADMEEVRQG